MGCKIYEMRSWLVRGVARQSVQTTGCKTEEAAAALASCWWHSRNHQERQQRVHIAHLGAAGEIFASGVALAWLFEAPSRGHQAVWRDGDAIAHEPTAARALMSPEHGHGPAM